MHRTPTLLALVVALAIHSAAAGQEVSLVDLPSGMQIEVQPQTDHLRVHVQARFQNAAGRAMFVSLETTFAGAETKSTVTQEVDVTAADEVWDIFLRAPLNSQAVCGYTLKLGPTSTDPLRPERPRLGFRWIVQRSAAGEQTLVAERDGQPLEIGYQLQRPIFEMINGNPSATMIFEELTMPSRPLRIGMVEDTRAIEFGLQKIR